MTTFVNMKTAKKISIRTRVTEKQKKQLDKIAHSENRTLSNLVSNIISKELLKKYDE